MSGKLFDEWSVGEEFVTPGRTMTETDVVMFAAMSGDYNELHTSEAFMRNSQFGRRIVHGLLGLAVSHGLLFRTGYLEGTAIAFLGIDAWKFSPFVFRGNHSGKGESGGKNPEQKQTRSRGHKTFRPNHQRRRDRHSIGL